MYSDEIAVGNQPYMSQFDMDLVYKLNPETQYNPVFEGLQSNCPLLRNVTTDNVLDQRTEKDISKEIKDFVDLITIQEDILPVGSYRYKTHTYSSDIDIFEPINPCGLNKCTLNKVRLDIVEAFQKIVKKIKSKPYIYLTDFKAGFDMRYKIYFGEIIENKVIDFDPRIAYNEIVNLFEQRLINEDEYNEMIKLISGPTSNISVDNFDKLDNIVRSHYVLRWKEDEILLGYKILPLNKKKWLYDALIEQSVVKMDLIVPLPFTRISEQCLDRYKNKNSLIRYTEITNWFMISYTNITGEVIYITAELNDYIKSLSNDIRKYLPTNALKATKRYWSILIYQYNQYQQEENYEEMENIENILVALGPLFSNYISLLNMTKGDLEVILTLDPLIKNKKLIYTTIDGIYLRLECYCEQSCCKQDKYYDHDINKQVMKMIDSIRSSKDIKSIIDRLQKITHEKTIQYLNDANIEILY